MERLVIMVPQETIGPADLTLSLRTRTGPTSEAPDAILEWDGTLREARERFEREYILRRLREANWNVTRTAERLALERSNLHRKIKAYGIELPRE
jgi:two-component system nitrogen regulation response regulator NtrX